MSSSLTPRKYFTLGIFCLVCLSAGAIGGIATSSSVSSWYPTLQKPWFNPPNWIFGPVWTVLYTMMGVAAWRVWLRGHAALSSKVLGMFWFQLGLNLLWSLIFFGLRKIGLAAAEIVLLLLAIIITTYLFYRIDRLAGILMIPYIAWVSFATILNLAIWILNQG